MKLYNQTRQCMLADPIEQAVSLSDKMTGLLKDTIPRALLLQTRWGIHTFGMAFPIDCLVMDKHLTVRALRKQMPPQHIWLWNPRHTLIAELPAGSLERSGTRIGDSLILY